MSLTELQGLSPTEARLYTLEARLRNEENQRIQAIEQVKLTFDREKMAVFRKNTVECGSETGEMRTNRSIYSSSSPRKGKHMRTGSVLRATVLSTPRDSAVLDKDFSFTLTPFSRRIRGEQQLKSLAKDRLRPLSISDVPTPLCVSVLQQTDTEIAENVT